MNGYAKKVSRTLLLGLAILAIAGLIYLVYSIFHIDSMGATVTIIIWGVYIITMIYLFLEIKLRKKGKR